MIALNDVLTEKDFRDKLFEEEIEREKERFTLPPDMPQGFIVVYGCPKCKVIWPPKKKNPRACPGCKRYFKGTFKPVRVRVPENYFKGQVVLTSAKTIAVPENVVEMFCAHCGNSFVKGAVIDGLLLCPNCALQKILDSKPKTRTFKDLIVDKVTKDGQVSL